FRVMSDALRPGPGKAKELRRWKRDDGAMRGAVADAFALLRYGHCKPRDERAEHFGIDKDIYAVLRKIAAALLFRLCDEAERAWLRARFAQTWNSGNSKINNLRNPRRETPADRHDAGEDGIRKAAAQQFGKFSGKFYARPLSPDDDA